MEIREAGWEHPWLNHLAERQLVCFFTSRRKVAFFHELRRLVKSGLGLPDALTTMARYRSGAHRRALLRARAVLDGGGTLRQGLSPYAHHLGRTYVELVGFGEQSGSLEAVLTKIAEDLERQQSLRWKFLLPALYIVYLLVGVILVGPLAGIGPAIRSGETESPGWAGSALFGRYFQGLGGNVLLVLFLFALYFLLPMAVRLLGLEELHDRIKLRNPITGAVFRNLYGSRFFMTLGLAVSAGMDMVRALRLSASSTGSALVRARAPRMVSLIDRGALLADAVGELDVFPGSMIGSLAVSEKAGELDEGLRQLARESEERTVHYTKILAVGIVAVVVVLLIGKVLSLIFANLMGPIKDYYDLMDQI